MTFRDGDDDTSTGRTTQGGRPRRGGAGVWLILGVVAVIAALLLIRLTTPHRSAPAERGTTPVSSTRVTPGPPSS